MKLLYAEDEPAMAEAVTDILTYHHYSVDTVHDGADALDYARSGQYDTAPVGNRANEAKDIFQVLCIGGGAAAEFGNNHSHAITSESLIKRRKRKGRFRCILCAPGIPVRKVAKQNDAVY